MKLLPTALVLTYVAVLGTVAAIAGCMTVGYSTARDADLVAKWTVTVTKLEPRKIYNALGASLVGPLAPVEHTGLAVTFIDEGGKTGEITQPATVRDAGLKVGDKATYIADRGQVWVQPTDYPLPPEFK